MEVKDVIFAALSASAGFIISLFGSDIQVVTGLCVLIILDYITGITKAVCVGNLSSKFGFIGILRKFLIFLVIIVANFTDVYILQNESHLIRNMVSVFYMLNEAISVLENISCCGVPLPDRLTNLLNQEKLKNKGGE